MLSIIRNILKFISHHSLGEFLKRSCRILIKPLYENNARYIFKLNLSSAVDADPALVIKEITIADINRMLDVMYINSVELQKRFDHGDRCFAVLDENKIISYFWARFADREFPELHLKFNLHSNQTWMYNAITVKAARGRGLYPNIIRHMAKVLMNSGIDEAFIDVDPDNIASRRGLEKAGCKYIVLVRVKKMFSNINYELTVFDTSGWQELSGMVEGFNQKRLRYIMEPDVCP